MIDIENDIYRKILDALVSSFPYITAFGEQPPTMSKFPCVIIEEKDNAAYDRTQDSGSLENHASVMYEVNVYSNRANGKKDECKQIQNIIDCQFEALGFTRISKVPMTIADATVYRIVSRYRAVVSKNKEIYRR